MSPKTTKKVFKSVSWESLTINNDRSPRTIDDFQEEIDELECEAWATGYRNLFLEHNSKNLVIWGDIEAP